MYHICNTIQSVCNTIQRCVSYYDLPEHRRSGAVPAILTETRTRIATALDLTCALDVGGADADAADV